MNKLDWKYDKSIYFNFDLKLNQNMPIHTAIPSSSQPSEFFQ